ncbi:MAG: [FeFe] hydrogenase H-cluster radical SAM maturase HydE [Spirochaetia bacterium]
MSFEKKEKIINKLFDTSHASRKELTYILGLDQKEAIALFEAAEEKRRKVVGDGVHLRSIVEFSSACRCHCAYCGLNASNRCIPRYSMSDEAILAAVDTAHKASYRTVVLQSGEDLSFTKERVSNLVKNIKIQYSDMAVTLSLGERPIKDYLAFKAAGADRYLIKHETCDPLIYQRMHPGSTIDERIACTKILIKTGFQTGGGFMIGLPGQTHEIIAKDLLLIQKLDLRMAGIGPFIPHAATPLRHVPAGDIFLSLKAVALARLVVPKALIPATSSLNVLSGDITLALKVGANVLMQKAEPENFRKLYEIYPKPIDGTDLATLRQKITSKIESIGRFVSGTRGDYGEDAW